MLRKIYRSIIEKLAQPFLSESQKENKELINIIESVRKTIEEFHANANSLKIKRKTYSPELEELFKKSSDLNRQIRDEINFLRKYEPEAYPEPTEEDNIKAWQFEIKKQQRELARLRMRSATYHIKTHLSHDEIFELKQVMSYDRLSKTTKISVPDLQRIIRHHKINTNKILKSPKDFIKTTL